VGLYGHDLAASIYRRAGALMIASSPNAYEILEGNDPFCAVWQEGSFVGRLTEKGQFDGEAYATLEDALVRIAAESPGVKTLGCIMRVFEQVSLLIRWHFDDSEAYRIENLDNEQLLEFDQRFRFLLIDLSLGNAPDMSQWGSTRYELPGSEGT
jgi:Immunity protein 41